MSITTIYKQITYKNIINHYMNSAKESLNRIINSIKSISAKILLKESQIPNQSKPLTEDIIIITIEHEQEEENPIHSQCSIIEKIFGSTIRNYTDSVFELTKKIINNLHRSFQNNYNYFLGSTSSTQSTTDTLQNNEEPPEIIVQALESSKNSEEIMKLTSKISDIVIKDNTPENQKEQKYIIENTIKTLLNKFKTYEIVEDKITFKNEIDIKANLFSYETDLLKEVSLILDKNTIKIKGMYKKSMPLNEIFFKNNDITFKSNWPFSKTYSIEKIKEKIHS